jgi:hypothetical protein
MLQDGKSRFHTRLDTKLARIDVTPNLTRHFHRTMYLHSDAQFQLYPAEQKPDSLQFWTCNQPRCVSLFALTDSYQRRTVGTK